MKYYQAQVDSLGKLICILSRHPGAMLRGEEGTGKTIISAQVASQFYKALYIAPAKAIPDIKKKLKQYQEEYGITHNIEDVISYDKFKDEHKVTAWSLRKYPLLIFDECHIMKGWGHGATQRMRRLSLNGRKFLFMSGTPKITSEFDLIYCLRQCGLWKNKSMDDIKIRYFNAVPSRYHRGLIKGDFTRGEEFYSHTKKVTVGLTQKMVDPDIAEMVIKEINYNIEAKPFDGITKETEIRRQNGLLKAQNAGTDIREISCTEKGPFLVLTHFHDVATEVANRIGCPVALTSDKVYKGFEDLRRGKEHILVTTLGLTQSSLDLNECNHVFMVESTYAFATDRQSIRRCLRIGKRDTLNVYYFKLKNERPVAISMGRKHLTEIKGAQ